MSRDFYEGAGVALIAGGVVALLMGGVSEIAHIVSGALLIIIAYAVCRPNSEVLG